MAGVAGTVTSVEAKSTFKLIIKNPCIDSEYVSIVSSALPDSLVYVLHSYDQDAKFSFTHDPFSIDYKPFDHDLCGTLSYASTFNGNSIDANSEPVSYDWRTNKFAIYSEDFGLTGMNQITVQAYLIYYP